MYHYKITFFKSEYDKMLEEYNNKLELTRRSKVPLPINKKVTLPPIVLPRK